MSNMDDELMGISYKRKFREYDCREYDWYDYTEKYMLKSIADVINVMAENLDIIEKKLNELNGGKTWKFESEDLREQYRKKCKEKENRKQ